MIDYLDPVALLVHIFEEKYPDKSAQVDFVGGIDDSEFHGETCFGEDGKVRIQISIEQTVPQVLDILAHELSHLAVGEDVGDEHGTEFTKVYDGLNEEFNKRMEEVYRNR